MSVEGPARPIGSAEPSAATTPVTAPALLDGDELTELLVPIGPSPTWNRGAATAIRYARRWNLPVRLLHVRSGDGPSEGPDAVAEAQRLTITHEIEVSGEEVESDAIAPAVAAAVDGGSLIVLATDHVDQLTSPGSVGERIVRASDRPVVLCGPHCLDGAGTGRVVVALDGSTWAESALPPAIAVAASLGVTLWLVNVAPQAAVARAAELRERGERVSLSGYIRETAERLEAEGVDVGWELVQGDIAAGILQFALRRGAELIVATTHGETGLARRVLGSVSMTVVRNATSPVLIVPTEARHSSELP